MNGFYTYIDVQNYTLKRHDEILKLAETQGHPLEQGSYIEKMTIAQLDRLTQGVYDA